MNAKRSTVTDCNGLEFDFFMAVGQMGDSQDTSAQNEREARLHSKAQIWRVIGEMR